MSSGWDPEAELKDALAEIDKPAPPQPRTIAITPPPAANTAAANTAAVPSNRQHPAPAPAPVSAPTISVPTITSGTTGVGVGEGIRRAVAKPAVTKPGTRIAGIVAEPTRSSTCEVAVTIARRFKQARLDADLRLERFNAVRFVADAVAELPADLEPVLDLSVLNLRARRGDPEHIDTERITVRISTATDQRLAIAINEFY